MLLNVRICSCIDNVFEEVNIASPVNRPQPHDGVRGMEVSQLAAPAVQELTEAPEQLGRGRLDDGLPVRGAGPRRRGRRPRTGRRESQVRAQRRGVAGRAHQVVGREQGRLRRQRGRALAGAARVPHGHVQLLEARQRLDVLVVVHDRVDAVQGLPHLVVLLLAGRRREVLPRESIDEQRVLLEVVVPILLLVVVGDVVDVVLGRRLAAVVVLGVVEVVGGLPLARGEAQDRPHGGCQAANGAVRIARGQGLASCQALVAARIAIAPLSLPNQPKAALHRTSFYFNYQGLLKAMNFSCNFLLGDLTIYNFNSKMPLLLLVSLCQ